MNARRSCRTLRSGLFRSQTRSIGARVIMLVTFSCKAYPNITMFGDVAVRLLKMMGHSGTVPSAILAADIPAAVAKLEAAVVGQGSVIGLGSGIRSGAFALLAGQGREVIPNRYSSVSRSPDAAGQSGERKPRPTSAHKRLHGKSKLSG